MLINLSNHPSFQWELPQLQAATAYGEVIDLPFPEIDPECDTDDIQELAREYLNKVKLIATGKNAKPVVHLMGEYSFCFMLTNLLRDEGIKTLVSTTMRESVINPDGTKTIRFNFVKFRSYYQL